MSRFFLEVSYKGTNYSGSQSQKNANTIQAELEKAFKILQKEKIVMTGSSRTDAGVHALQNYFHFDYEGKIHSQFVYKMNAILPSDIVAKKIIPVNDEAHCRFDAVAREYKYYIYHAKDPFLLGRAYYYPYKLNWGKLNKAASIIKEYHDFTSFSKSRSQAKTFLCEIFDSIWTRENDCLVYYVKANRFLRGMVRALVATMLLVGRESISINEFKNIIESKDCKKARFNAPAAGLFLISIQFFNRE
jgi:tRNA pseudouridine38-40 synthase